MVQWIAAILEQLRPLEQYTPILQPIATISASLVVLVASFVAICVTRGFAWHQTAIARGQADVARAKLRLDLYDRRFAILISILDFANATLSWEGTPEQQDAQTKFLKAYLESRFLFEKKSKIEPMLEHLLDQGMKVITFESNGDKLKSDDPKQWEQLRKQVADIQLKEFPETIEKLKVAMHPYLDFSRVS